MPALSPLRRHPLPAFLVGSVALGWLVTLISAQLPSSSVLLPLIAIPVSYIPAAGGLDLVTGPPLRVGRHVLAETPARVAAEA